MRMRGAFVKMRTIRGQLILLTFVINLGSMLIAMILSKILGNLLLTKIEVIQNRTLFVLLRDLMMPGLFIAVCLCATGIMSKSMVSSIHTLSEQAQRIAGGDLDVQIAGSGRNDEIGELERSFAQMVKGLRANEYMRKSFINNVSHEFKTPLSIIQGYAELLTDDDLPDEERIQCAQMIHSESARLARLSANILRISRLDSQGLSVAATSFSLDEQIRQTVLKLEPAWRARDIVLDIDIHPETGYGDEELLAHVWYNLVENAIKFSPHGGTIRIRMGSSSDIVQVSIQDHGEGMTAETKARMYEQFYQGDSSREREGSGLGLPLVKRIVDLHGGEIEVRSELGRGSMFIVTLPRGTDRAPMVP